MNAGWQIGIICKISSGAGSNMFKIRGCATVLWYSLENSHMDFYSPALNFINHCDGLENRWKQGRLSQSYGRWRGLEIWKKSGFGILGVEELSKNGRKKVNYRKAYLLSSSLRELELHAGNRCGFNFVDLLRILQNWMVCKRVDPFIGDWNFPLWFSFVAFDYCVKE